MIPSAGVCRVRPRLLSGCHVYAPGVAGYKPIALTLHAAPGLLLRDAQYPRAGTSTFKPLNEQVQVYQRPFRIVQDVTIDPSPQGAAVNLRQLDRERATP